MSTHGGQGRFARWVRRLAIPIAIFWLALAASTNALVPPLEEVGRIHNVAANAPDAPSLIASKRVGQVFGEYDSDSLVTLVLEGDQPLGDEAHRYGHRQDKGDDRRSPLRGSDGHEVLHVAAGRRRCTALTVCRRTGEGVPSGCCRPGTATATTGELQATQRSVRRVPGAA